MSVVKWFARSWLGDAVWCSAECLVGKQVRIVRILSSSDDLGVGRTNHIGTCSRRVVPLKEAFDSLDAALMNVITGLKGEVTEYENMAQEAREEIRRVEVQRRKMAKRGTKS